MLTRTLPISIDEPLIADFCQRYQVAEFALFGSVLRADFSTGSDVDVLIALKPGNMMTLEADRAMREELSAMFGGRRIDMVRKEYLKNPYRREEILRSREIMYAV